MSATLPFVSAEARVWRDIPELNALAVSGLTAMFDKDHKLFCQRFRRPGRSFGRDAVSHRYSTMALLGLCELRKTGAQVPFDFDAAVSACAADTRWVKRIGDLGLLLWLISEC